MKSAARYALVVLLLLAVIAVAGAVIAVTLGPQVSAALAAYWTGRQGYVLADANAYQLRTQADMLHEQSRALLVAAGCGLVAFGGFGAALVVLALRAQRRERWMLAGRRQAALPADLVPSDTTRCFPLELRWGISAEEVRARIAEYQARGKE